MGRTVDVRSIRLGTIYGWEVSKDVEHETKEEIFLINYIKGLFEKKKLRGLTLSSVKVENINNKALLKIFVYESLVEEGVDGLEAGSLYIKRLRLGLYNLLGKILKKECGRFLKKEVKIELYILDEETVSADFLAKYFSIRLKDGRSLYELYRTVGGSLSYMVRNGINGLLGCKIVCKGRLGKKARASKDIFKIGRLPLSTIMNVIDFSKNEVILKYGLCSIKVWLVRKENAKKYKYKVVV